jgi:hypothetical protein
MVAARMAAPLRADFGEILCRRQQRWLVVALSVLLSCASAARAAAQPGAGASSSPSRDAAREPAREPPASPPDRATPAPPEAAIIVGEPQQLAAMAARLAGHRVQLGDHVLLLHDVAGQGRPWVGVVVARCGQLWLHTAVTTLRLTGPLARMRLAGPGYLMWAVGVRRPAPGAAASAHGDELALSRLGVLAPPEASAASAAGEPRRDEPPCSPAPGS